MKFGIGEEVGEYYRGTLSGSQRLMEIVNATIQAGEPCGCNYWGVIEPSLATPWQAYLTICGAISQAYGQEPWFYPVPPNPAGYDEEGSFQ